MTQTPVPDSLTLCAVLLLIWTAPVDAEGYTPLSVLLLPTSLALAACALNFVVRVSPPPKLNAFFYPYDNYYDY